MFLLSLLLFSCLGGPSSTDKFMFAPLNGKIFDYDNLPCSGVLVTVDKSLKVKSDINGRFVIPSLGKGVHDFTLSKDGFETQEFEFDFINKNQVLWLKMLSLEQIISLIEIRIDENKLDEANNLIQRAQKINPKNTVVLYLTAIYKIHTKAYEEAVETLTSILETGDEEPIIYLTLADICEHKLEDMAKALEYLEKYNSLQYDEEVVQRIEYLKSIVPET